MEKVLAEGWAEQGRDPWVKAENFAHGWVTEEAFAKILKEKKIWFRNRGLYVGDSEGAGSDFYVRQRGEVFSIGLRSINKDSLSKYHSVAYPDDRFRDEPYKIATFVVACYHELGVVDFLGAIKREDLLTHLQSSSPKLSKRNQELFRTVPLEAFSVPLLDSLFDSLDRV